MSEQREKLISLIKASKDIEWESSRSFKATIVDLESSIQLIKDVNNIISFSSAYLDDESVSVEFCQFDDSLSKTFTYSLQLPAPSQENAIVRNLSSLLRLADFVTVAPKHYYSIEDDSDVLPKKYRDTITFANFLLKIADHVELSTGEKKCFFYHGIKTEIIIHYTEEDLKELPGVESFINGFADSPHLKERIEILKELIIKYSLGQPAEQAFATLLVRFSKIEQDFNQSWSLFITDFSLDKLLDELETKTLSLADKLATSLSELQKTMITIPLAILLVASQIDAAKDFESLKNISILAGIWVFHLFTLAFFWGHKRSLKFIENELSTLQQEVKDKYPEVEKRVNPKFVRLQNRCTYQANYRRIVGTLMWLVVLSLTLLVIKLKFGSPPIIYTTECIFNLL